MNHIHSAATPGASHSTPSYRTPHGRGRSADEVSGLLRRYPEVDEAERLELVHLLQHGHPDTLAMAVYGAGLQAKAVAVKKDHPEHFRSALRYLLPWIVALGALLPLLLLIAHL